MRRNKTTRLPGEEQQAGRREGRSQSLSGLTDLRNAL